MSNGRVGRVRSLPVDRSWPQSVYATCTGSIECILCNCGSDSWKVPSLKLSANFCRVSVIFRYSAGTRVSSVVVYSDFTSKSPDYVLSKAGLFSTKLSQTTIAWTRLFYTKSPFFSSFSRFRNHTGGTCARRGMRFRTVVAQSRDRASVLRNLGIPRKRNTILRLRKFPDCAEHAYLLQQPQYKQ